MANAYGRDCISVIGFGIRSSFGLFLEPMTAAQGWTRETFGLAMALQNLFWGLGLPIAGILADKWGSSRVIISGATAYFVEVYSMAMSDTQALLYLTGGVLSGLGIAFSAFTLAMASIVRAVGPEKRSFVLGIGTAAGSAGQVLFSPIGQGFINSFGWQQALVILSFMALNGTLDHRYRGAGVWDSLYGNLVRHRLSKPSDWQLSRRVARRQALRQHVDSGNFVGLAGSAVAFAHQRVASGAFDTNCH